MLDIGVSVQYVHYLRYISVVQHTSQTTHPLMQDPSRILLEIFFTVTPPTHRSSRSPATMASTAASSPPHLVRQTPPTPLHPGLPHILTTRTDSQAVAMMAGFQLKALADLFLTGRDQ